MEEPEIFKYSFGDALGDHKITFVCHITCFSILLLTFVFIDLFKSVNDINLCFYIKLKSMVCYLSKSYKEVNSAGSKAKMDIERIMEDLGFRNVGLRQALFSNAVIAYFYTLFSVLKGIFCLHKDDVLVLQYPLKKYYSFICNAAHWKGCKVITVIHDLGSFRRKRLTVEQEIARLNHSDYVIAHNKKMKGWLENHGCKALLGTLGIFDYLSSTMASAPEPSETFRVLYAGGLSLRKNAFLYEVGKYIHSSCRFSLYGNGFELENAAGKEFFDYMGFVSSDDLIAGAQGDFGLVWDGASVSSCTGDFGEYLQYNNPHKTSLYIRCNLPVIIWNKAALADFVRENGVGLCLDSLEDLDATLAALTPEQYQTMKRNVVAVSDRLAGGGFFTQAVMDAIETLKKERNDC